MEAEKDSPALSEEATEELLKLLVVRGYFHNDVDAPVAEEQHDESLEAMLRAKEKERVKYTEMDAACQLVSTWDGCYVTRSRLQKDLLQELQSCGGRLSFSDAAIALAIDLTHVERAAEALSSGSEVELVGPELISSKYLDEMAVDIESQLTMEGQVRVSDLAEKVCIPTEVMLQVLTERLDGKPIRGKLITEGGVTQLVSPKFEESQQRRVVGAFSSLTMPASLESVCDDFGWEVSNILLIVRDLCSNCIIPGELHESGSSSSGAMYVPTIYLEMQRKSVDDFFASNGYITAEMCISMGIVASQMGEYVKKSFPSAVILTCSVINQDVVASPLEEVIKEAITCASFVDLKIHLPEDYSNTADINEIVNNSILPKLAQSKGKSKEVPGICVTIDGEALFFSSGMIESITKKIIPRLVEAYGKSRAEEIDCLITELPSSPSSKKRTASLGSDEDDHKTRKAKGRRKGKKAKKDNAPSVNPEYGVVPLTSVAIEVASEYPDLADIQDSYGPLAEDGVEGAPAWETSGDDVENDNDVSKGGPLYEFCRAALYTPKLRENSARAVQAELDRIQAAKQAISVSSRKDGAAKVRNIEHAFEDKSCFPTACYLVQMHAKFIEYASTSDLDDVTLSALKKDFLKGCCADFTRRITEYCLFKNEIEDGMFLFERDSADSDSKHAEEDSLQRFCQPVNTAVRSFPDVYLSCPQGEDGVAREPLPVIRKLLAGNVGNVGVALARMWTLCGGDCYDGGTRISDDGVEYTRPGDYDGFLKHVEDSCLTICGLPFKKLDKKSEKQALFSRRQELTQALKDATEGELALDLTVMLLFQQVKGLATSGSLLSGPILTMLTREKKVPEPVSNLLKKLADGVRDKEEIDEELIESVKACGLSRDISKHQVQ